ncbi:MAG TPA: glycosyltransferase family 87 protein [Methylomirabilota bacterium]|nr:glycosyltransferase family 87 protein [Methylomirabilota bacterium]
MGTLALVALGLLSAALYACAVPAAHWLGLEPLALHVPITSILFGLYLLALGPVMGRLRSTRSTLIGVLGFAFLFRLLLLPTPVYLSSDIYRYLWDGRVQWAGVNPYRHPPAALELAALRDPVTHPHINRPTAVTAYPPGAQWLFALAALVAPGSILGWRVLLLAIEAATCWILLRVLRRLGAPGTAILAYAWSPLVIFEGVQAGHVDLAVVPLVLVALRARLDGSSVRAGVLIGLAALVKVYPLILVVACWRRRDWRFPAAAAVTITLGYLPYAWPLGVGALGFLPSYFLDRREDFNLGLRALLTWGLGLSGETVRRVAIVLLLIAVGGALAWIGARHRDRRLDTWQAAGLAVGAWLVLGPFSVHPWYVLWLVLFLCVNPSPAWLYFSGAVSLSYVEYLVQPAGLPWWAWLGEYGPLYVLLGVRAYRAWSRPGSLEMTSVRSA